MSFTDHLVLWLHIAFALFTIGPLTVATMSTPRYVRARNLPVLRYLARMTRIFSVISLGVLILGIVAAQLRKDFSHPWLSVSMTLFVVALALLLLVMRDQHRAIVALDAAAKAEAAAASAGEAPGEPAAEQPDSEQAPDEETAKAAPATTQIPQLASVERGRIASLAGLASVIWLVILALMVWQP
jgi:hypothetical protein